MIHYLKFITLFFFISACTNSPEIHTGEIRALELIRDSFLNWNETKVNVDSKKLLTRDKIDKIDIPILFVQLENGQNGTLTQYPGQGIGQTWLGADGATLTLRQGALTASRGLGDDIMGGSSNLPSWSQVMVPTKYERTLSYLGGNNRIYTRRFNCSLEKNDDQVVLNVWDASFEATLFNESCLDKNGIIKNKYFVENSGLVRRSIQYHSETLGYIITERLDR